jgi:hypothetical protein
MQSEKIIVHCRKNMPTTHTYSNIKKNVISGHKFLNIFYTLDLFIALNSKKQ